MCKSIIYGKIKINRKKPPDGSTAWATHPREDVIIIAKRKRAVLYLRYSSDKQTEQSIEGQEHVCRDYARTHDLKIVGSYIDRARSASKDIEKRTEFLRMIEDAESGDTFDVVLVYKLDRFARDRADSAIYKRRLKLAGVSVESATESLGSGPESVIMESMLEGFAQYYSMELSQKIRRGQRESVAKRKFLGGRVPYGFMIQDGRLVPDPVTSLAVKLVFEHANNGAAFTEIANIANAAGYRTQIGTPFSCPFVHRILHNKRYIGYYIYKDVEVPDACEPIVSEELFESVQKRLKRERRRKKKYMDNEYLLSGKLYCGHCGELMQGDSGTSETGKTYFYYSCYGKKKKRSGCHKANVRKDDIEAFVLAKAREQLTSEVMGKLATDIFEVIDERQKRQDRTPALLEQLKEVDRKISNIVDVIADGRSSSALTARLDKLEEEKEALQTSIEKERKARTRLITKEDIAEWLAKVKLAEVESDRALIDAFIEKVVLFDEDDGKNRKIQIFYRLSDPSKSSDIISYAPPFVNLPSGNCLKVFLYPFERRRLHFR